MHFNEGKKRNQKAKRGKRLCTLTIIAATAFSHSMFCFSLLVSSLVPHIFMVCPFCHIYVFIYAYSHSFTQLLGLIIPLSLSSFAPTLGGNMPFFIFPSTTNHRFCHYFRSTHTPPAGLRPATAGADSTCFLAHHALCLLLLLPPLHSHTTLLLLPPQGLIEAEAD